MAEAGRSRASSGGGRPPIEDLMADQRRRGLAGDSLRVEDYFDRSPGLRDDPEALLDLIYSEIFLREGRGEAPGLAEYQARFPSLAGPLADLFEVHGALDPTDPAAEAPKSSPGGVLPSLLTEAPGAMSPVLPSWPKLDGYEIVDILGSGGMGVVYLARDRRRGVMVAVKTMRHEDASAVSRFKQEFRALQDVSHPNLVALHELISGGGAWFIVMERLDGSDFLAHVRSVPAPAAEPTASPTAPSLPPTEASGSPEGPPISEPPPTLADAAEETQASPTVVPGRAAANLTPAGASSPLKAGMERLRRALVQLAEGLVALHEAGKLHRDIKPSNVMVTRSGRVVLMDFGLIATKADEGLDSTGGQLVGTVSYMAPEQAAGGTLSEASDWYSVGVMLYEALTGRRPFVGKPLEILLEKQAREPTPPRDLVPDLPEDLHSLCVDLMRLDPASRPSGREVLARLGASTAESSTAPRGDVTPFLGREPQRAALAEALEATASGRTVIVFVHGRSGVGKSALVRAFLDELTASGGAVVLAGRCYERESVPYKALDSLIEALGRHLRHLPPHESEALLPRDVGPLSRVFPVLRRVSAVASAPRRAVESPDPQELRRRGYAALRELLARLGDRQTLVLAIDDLQWGDTDSLAVLTEVLRLPDPPVLLLLASYRSEEAASPFLRAVLDWPAAKALDCRELAVGPLSPEESRALARQLMGMIGPDAERRAEAVARESGGNPLFVAELARSVQSGGLAAGGDDDERAAIDLDEVLWSRVLRLPEEARTLLEVVAVSGGAIRPDVAWRCLDRDGDDRATFALLRAGRLVRGAGGAPDVGRVETYHDRVREAVVAHLAPEVLTSCHRRLAIALEASGDADHEELGVHLRGAGEFERAGEQFALAAAQAADALAFDRASALYRTALELLPPEREGRRQLRAALGEALANAGRGAEAAGEYLAACEGTTVAEALELRRLAALQLLISGHMDRGLDALRDVLAAIGMTLPATPGRSLASLLWRRARLRLRGTRFRPRDPSEIAAAELTRVDVCWSAGLGLSNVDWIRGADFQARGLLLALKAGDPPRVARALAVEAAQVSTAGRPARRRTARLLADAGALANASGQPYALGMVTLAHGVSAYLEGRWADALDACDRAEATFRDRCTGVAWELDTAHAYALWSLSHLGRWAELGRRFPLLLNEARERGDLYAAMNLSTYIRSVLGMATDDAEAAREETRRVMGQWSSRGYHVQHNDQVWASVQVSLYLGDGDAAWEEITRHWPTLRGSLLLKVQFIRVAMVGLRARCALAAAEGDGPHLRSAARDAAKLGRERLPWARAQASMIQAALAARRGRREEAAALLARASETFRGCHMALSLAAADRRRGEILGGPEGIALASRSDAAMAAEAIRRPDRVADLLAPGFPRI